MKKTQINREHKNLIVSIIKENHKYHGNEELLDFFVEAIYKKSYLIIDAIRDKKRVKRHLAVICDTCMEQIIKEKQRYNNFNSKNSPEFKQNNEPVSIKKTPFMENEGFRQKESKNEDTDTCVVNLKEEIQRSEKYDAVDSLVDPADFYPAKRISENTADKLIQIVKSIEALYPNKRYFEIFSYRYMKKFNQADTAKEMKISQVELSKRFIELVQLVREQL